MNMAWLSKSVGLFRDVVVGIIDLIRTVWEAAITEGIIRPMQSGLSEQTFILMTK